MRHHEFKALLVFTSWLTGCTGMFYQPSRDVFAAEPANAENVELRSADGTRLRGWVLHAEDGHPKATFVHFHGNGGNITGHVRQLQWVTRHSYDLFEFDYRGYGGSDGFPSPKGVHEDAVAAIKYAARVLGPRSHTRLVFYGQSLGGAVMLRALADAGPELVDAVVVESSFHSYQEVAASAFFRTPILFPFTGLAYATISDEYAPARYVATVSPIPLLVIHGDDDAIVDVRFGRILYALGRQPKELWIIPGGRHVDAMRTAGAIYRERLLRFVEASQAGSAGPATAVTRNAGTE
jgi:fermentation-respiration switch protein FrsA (DUF1100 family)